MEFLNQTVCVKQWHVFVMLLLSGFATGSMIAKIATAIGL
jgi:hypothetical protein